MENKKEKLVEELKGILEEKDICKEDAEELLNTMTNGISEYTKAQLKEVYAALLDEIRKEADNPALSSGIRALHKTILLQLDSEG